MPHQTRSHAGLPEREKHRILDYIAEMSLELAALAEKAEARDLGHDLREVGTRARSQSGVDTHTRT